MLKRKYESKEEHELLLAATIGDKEAFDRLYDTYCQPLIEKEMEEKLKMVGLSGRLESACAEVRKRAENSLKSRFKGNNYKSYIKGIAINVRAEISMIDAKNGNKEALGMFYEDSKFLTKRRIRLKIMEKMFMRNVEYVNVESIVEEVYNDAFEGLIKNLPNYDILQVSKIHSYLETIVERKLFDALEGEPDKIHQELYIKKDMLENKYYELEEGSKQAFESYLINEKLGNQMSTELLKIIIKKGGYPHQVIAFLFSNMVYPFERLSRSSQGLPKDVANNKELWEKKLEDVLFILKNRHPIFNKTNTNDVFEPLEVRINTLISDILVRRENDSYTWDLLNSKNLLCVKVGVTTLLDYCNIPQEKDEQEKIKMRQKYVTDWSNKVKKRVCSYYRKTKPSIYNDLKDLTDEAPDLWLSAMAKKSKERYDV